MICSLLLKNRFSTAETSQEQCHNIVFNLSCNISKQTSEIVAVLSCITLYTMLRGVLTIYFLKNFFVVRETGTGCPEKW